MGIEIIAVGAAALMSGKGAGIGARRGTGGVIRGSAGGLEVEKCVHLWPTAPSSLPMSKGLSVGVVVADTSKSRRPAPPRRDVLGGVP